MNTQNIVTPKEDSNPKLPQGLGSDQCKRVYFSKQSMGPTIQFSTTPNFLSFSKKKSDMKEPLTFNKVRNTETPVNSRNCTVTPPAQGEPNMYRSQVPVSQPTAHSLLTSLNNLAKDVSIEYGCLPYKNTDKAAPNSDSVIQRKQSMPLINSTATDLPLKPACPILNLAFKTKPSKIIRLTSPETGLSFKKKDYKTATKEYKGFKPQTSISTHSENTDGGSTGRVQNNSCFNFFTGKESAKDSFSLHLAETAASLSNVTKEETSAESKPVRKAMSLNDLYIKQKSKKIDNNIKLSDFQIIKHLGKGKFGNVSMVMHKETGFICALKSMEKSVISQQKLRVQLLRQIKIQLYLKHENIAQLYGYFDDDKHIYLLLQLCSGGQLYKILKDRKRLPEEEAIPLIRQLCEAVDYLHRNRILHRDIKPQNILIHQGLIKLCDFGWSVKMEETLRDTFCGTPIYVSPEILQGVKYDQKIDIWSIGVLSYEMLVGRIPFKINTPQDLHKIINDDISFPEYVPLSSEAKDFIRQILQKNPDDRLDVQSLLNHRFLKHK